MRGEYYNFKPEGGPMMLVIILLLIIIALLVHINYKIPSRDYTKEMVERAVERDRKEREDG
jgi:hypothetical protein